MIEIWKDIKGYEGYYQVSNMGDVVDNLEWCTAEYNDNYGERNTKISKALKEYANGY